MSKTTLASNDDVAAQIISIQQNLRRDLRKLEAMAENFRNRERDAKVALNKAVVEEQEAAENLNEAEQRYEEMGNRWQQSKHNLEVVLEEGKPAMRSMIQQNKGSLKTVYGTWMNSPVKTDGKKRVKTSRIDGPSAGARHATGVMLRVRTPPVTEVGHNHQMDDAVDRHDVLRPKWNVFAEAARTVTPPPLPLSAPTNPIRQMITDDGTDTSPGLMNAMIDNASPRRKELFTYTKCRNCGEGFSYGLYPADKETAMAAHRPECRGKCDQDKKLGEGEACVGVDAV
ncbi:hypothetical protein BLS_009183 [Venturia inaequalis]|uniref:Uncharacterized protein n=1 Tax=Venturia inaequalis TaxID=5025 RepID=A0A8H3U5S4_VENIN|nr:hypothetical protein BLS_009183 [Venturia inaequalis]KAE9964391.1 hypothetical protein EG328_010494 [Venturia inaequalis]